MNKFFSDTETYTEIKSKDLLTNPIRPYLYGTRNLTSDGWKTFIHYKLKNWLNHILKVKDPEVYFFNASYDIKAILYDLVLLINDPKYPYVFDLEGLNFDETGKFIYGNILVYNKNDEWTEENLVNNITIIDLWQWNKTMSIEKYSKQLFPNDSSYHKTKIDYDKNNVEIKDGKIYYYNKELENINHYWMIKGLSELKEISLDEEIDYLKRDVQIMPHIRELMIQQHKTAIKILDLKSINEITGKEINFKLPSTTGSMSRQLQDLYIKEKSREIQRTKEYQEDLEVPKGYKIETHNGKKVLVKRQGWYAAGFKIFNRDLQQDQKRIEKRNDEFLLTRHIKRIETILNSNMGGYTFNSLINEYFGDIYALDINSSYPGVESYYPLPYGELLDSRPLYGTSIKIYSIKYDEWIPNKEYENILTTQPLPTKGQIEPIIVFEPYLNKLQELGKIKKLEILDTFYMKTTTILKEYVEKLYNIKLNSKNPQERGAAKLCLNCSFGKKCEKPHYRKQVVVYDQSAGIFLLKTINNEKVPLGNITAGIFIAQMGRVELFKGVQEIVKHGGFCLYGDTDSIYSTIDPRKTNLKIHPKKLRAWDIESKNTKGEVEPYVYFSSLPGVKKKYLAIYKDGRRKLTFSGISDDVLKPLSNEELKILFQPDTNVCFIKSKKTALNNDFSQTVIINVDFQSNNKNEITHYVKDGKFYEKTNYQQLENKH